MQSNKQLLQRVAVLEGGTAKDGTEFKTDDADDASSVVDAAPMQMMQNPTFKQRRKSSTAAIRRKSFLKGKRRSSMQVVAGNLKQQRQNLHKEKDAKRQNI